MKLNEYLRELTPAERERLARKCGTKVSYLYQIAGGHRRPRADLAEAIERHTGQRVSKVELVFGDAAA